MLPCKNHGARIQSSLSRISRFLILLLMALSLPSLLFSYSLILSFAYLLFIHPLNMLVCLGSSLSNRAQESLVDEADHAFDETIIPPSNTRSNCIVSCLSEQSHLQKSHDETLMNRSFVNDSLHKKSRLTRSGSFPAPTSSHIRLQGKIQLDNNKQREIWPMSQGKESANVNKSKKLSLTEPVDKYGQLYETGSSKEIKRYVPRRIKLESENDKPNPRVSRRGLSLSELEYRSLLPNMEELTMPIDCNGHEKTGSVLKAPCEEDEMFSTVLFTSEDCESSNLDKGEIVEIPEDADYNFEYYYVKLVLDLSGFLRKGELYTGYSPEQPLDPGLFEEIESCYCDLDLHKWSAKSEQTRWVREVIFDMINEALVYLNERPYLYYPKALSFKCHVYPIPRGQQLLDKVWTFVSRSLNSRPDLNSLLDSVVSHVSNQIGGPMNLQIESECAAMEVEYLILDELLDEVLLACS